jgi:hypothetical protein
MACHMSLNLYLLISRRRLLSTEKCYFHFQLFNQVHIFLMRDRSENYHWVEDSMIIYLKSNGHFYCHVRKCPLESAWETDPLKFNRIYWRVSVSYKYKSIFVFSYFFGQKCPYSITFNWILFSSTELERILNITFFFGGITWYL